MFIFGGGNARAMDSLNKSMQQNERDRERSAARDAQRDADMAQQNQNFMKEMERNREANAAMLNAAASRQETSMERERASSKSVRDMMAEDKQLTEKRGDKRLEDAEVQRQNDMKLLHSQHKDSLEREGKSHERAVKTMEDERENTRKRQQEIDTENERKNDEERHRLQTLHEDKIKVMDANQEYEREQKDTQIRANEEKSERARDREEVLHNTIIQRADEDRRRAEERADMERERERMTNREMLQMININMNYERQRSLAVQDSLFTLTAMQRLPLNDGQSTYFPQGNGQFMGRQFAQPISGQTGNQPAQVAYQLSTPDQIEQPMPYAGNFGQPATSNPRAQIAYHMPDSGQIEQPMQYSGNFGQPATSNPRAHIAYHMPGPGQIEQPMPYAGNLGQPATSNPRAHIAYQMRGPGQIEQPIQYVGNLGQPAAITGQIRQQISAPEHIRQQIPIAGQYMTNERPTEKTIADQTGHRISTAEHSQQCAPLPVQQPSPNTGGLGSQLLTAGHSVQGTVNENHATGTATTDVTPADSVDQDSHTSAPLGDHIQIANSDLDTEAGELHIPDNHTEAELGLQHLSVQENL